MGVGVSLVVLAVTVWPAALYAALVLVVAALILTLSWLLGGKRYHGPEAERYESGIKPAGPLPQRLSVEFYQVALFFVIFDLEAVFIFSWAVAARSLGWLGYLELLVFVLLLFAGLVYLWRVGGLDWGAAGRRRTAARAAARTKPATGAGARAAEPAPELAGVSAEGAAAAGGSAGGAR
jgi:NADH-quinone oxidoreductase subunit A